jgi:hypothetical protein
MKTIEEAERETRQYKERWKVTLAFLSKVITVARSQFSRTSIEIINDWGKEFNKDLDVIDAHIHNVEFVVSEALRRYNYVTPEADLSTLHDINWIGCGECDCSFDCHEGKSRCIRLPHDKEAESRLREVEAALELVMAYPDISKYIGSDLSNIVNAALAPDRTEEVQIAKDVVLNPTGATFVGSLEACAGTITGTTGFSNEITTDRTVATQKRRKDES